MWVEPASNGKARSLLDSIFSLALNDTSTLLAIDQNKSNVVKVDKGTIQFAEFANHGKPFRVLANRALHEGATTIAFNELFLQCMGASAQPSKNKGIIDASNGLIANMARLVGTVVDFMRHDKWLDCSPILLAPSPRTNRVERVSQLYKEKVTQVAADTSCIHAAKIGWLVIHEANTFLN